MKKILAIILSVAMLCGVLAPNTFAADTTPKVTLITNEGSPVKEKTPTYFTVRFDDFASIKGMDVTITADGAELGEVSVTGFTKLKENLKEGDNFTKVKDSENNKQTIRIVDLTSEASTGKITFKVTAPEKDAIITVSGKYADSGKSLFDITTEDGLFEVYAKPENVEIEVAAGEKFKQSTAGEGKFIPKGSVFTVVNGEYVHAPKDENGDFTVKPTGYFYNSFDIPANGITTFGASNRINDASTIRFGSYSQKNDDTKTHGTMVFEGDWVLLMNYYIKNGYSVESLVNMIYQDFDNTLSLPQNHDKEFVYYQVPKEDGSGESERINVYKFPQQKYIWKNDDGVLEYGLQIQKVSENKTYAGVAYSYETGNKSNATVSAEVKFITVTE